MVKHNNPQFKEKFVELSEEVFKGNRQLDNASNWDNYLILPVNTQCIAVLIQNKSEEALLNMKTTLRSLFNACLDKLKQPPLNNSISEQTRQLNSIILLTALFRSLFAKKRLNHFNIISLLTGFDRADDLFDELITAIQSLIKNKSTRSLSLQLTLVLCGGDDNINQNGLNGYFMSNVISNTLIHVITDTPIDENDVRDSVMLLGLLANYNKYESLNPYLITIQKLDNKDAITNIIDMYTSTFISMRSRYIELKNDEETMSKALTSYMYRLFLTSAQEAQKEQLLLTLPSAQVALLLPLYELVYRNTSFYFICIRLCSIIDSEHTGHTEEKSTFLTMILSFASYLFQSNRNERTAIYSKLLLIILTRLMENNSIMNYLTKESSSAVVRLCRYRLPPISDIKKYRSMLCIVLDTLLLYIKHNLRKKLDLSAYKLAFTSIHRILLYLENNKIRLDYHWVEMWPSLASVLHFTVSRLDDLKQRPEFDIYLSSYITVFNMCISHGETFLIDTKSYDRLYYDIIRVYDNFLLLSAYVNSTINGKKTTDKQDMSLSSADFINIDKICKHFKPAIDEWQAEHNMKTLTPEQVTSIINHNYATLELSPISNINTCAAYTEIPSEMGFFRQTLRIAVKDYLECQASVE
ncbi:hypothetical protein BDB01DRAFT_847396 [Pilobolus umbonatus]|nr:hypothetical protein BDB01DRAFT_847396 [Pilobolus umbonatus]